ncbi:MAG TPA: tRNA (adenosine(37)-N6)-threonylcarbamoyltransferase complex dimerization subunit type 1 TsaB [Rhabdochlamydiaceae bacterium]|jgi:tRNA threonylcarbamoyl adenosine modification protein YeaZ|nr:tRNA (adenosine(37)-N6)-threonylcarbamoyltransferase complex dimerization subunit type 1 TsaB [Rhabdochlamydiaceae bacterium]
MKGIIEAMHSLIIDTTGSQAFIGFAENGRLLSQTIIPESRHLSKFLLTSIESILQASTPTFIAIGTGPGSFTGSRVGGIVAQTLGYGWNIPLISFSSTLLPDLDAIAALSYEKYLTGNHSTQIELVYISSSP